MLGQSRRAALIGTILIGAASLNPSVSGAAAASLCPTDIYTYLGGEWRDYSFQYECGEDLPGTACYRDPYILDEFEYAMFDCTTEDYVGSCDASSCRMTF